MNLFSTSAASRGLSIALLALRLALGAVFIAHGAQKLFMLGPAGTGAMLAQMGVPAAHLIGPILSIVEPLAGVAVLLGLLVRVAGMAIVIDMVGAIVTFHIRQGFRSSGGELVMMNCAAAIALVILGAGAFSIDHIIATRRSPR